jgi:bacillithiol biosynthesis deacetylase BshB1
MKLDILAISAHADDVEVAAGGTVLRHVAAGKTVGLLDLTRAELSTRGNAERRSEEARAAAALLGASVREQLALRDGFFQIDEASLLAVITALRKYRPEIVLANAPDDRHPDHGRAAALVVQAAFLANLRRVETTADGVEQSPWAIKAIYHYVQDRTCKADLIVDVSPYIDQKFAALSAYRSQFYDPSSTEPATAISTPDFFEALRGRNAMLGRQIGVSFAEAFTVTRPVGVRDLFDLL